MVNSTELDGLYFQDNLYTSSPDNKYFTVVSSLGPGVSDVVTHSPTFSYQHYGIHVGQTDRLTFFGDPNQVITGHFVDCRADSPTLHKYVQLQFNPDPRKMLHISRGIGHTFDGLANVLTRDEPEWFLSKNNPDYNIASDVVNVDRNIAINDFPVIRVNEHRIPRAAYDFMLDIQHVSLREMKRYPSRFPITLDGRKCYVSLRPKANV